MKTAVYGGSFNPVHKGHIAIAKAVHKLGYEQVLLVPSLMPPHKRLAQGASDQNRIEMLSIALSGCPWAVVWDGEIRRGGISYTIDTLSELRGEGLIDSSPGLVIGDDHAQGFSSWKNPNLLASSASIILARRLKKEAFRFPFSHSKLNNPLYPYSSTEIRNIAAEGGDLKKFLPPGVAEYIKERRLYGNP